MKNLLVTVALLSIATTNAQNWKSEKIKGNGNIVTQSRTTSEYDQIITGGSFTVELVSGKEGQLKLEGDENLLELIITKVENNKLKIYLEKGFSYDGRSSKIKITIPFETITRLDFGGSGSLSSRDAINTSSFELEMSGSSNSNLSINTTNLSIELSGSGNIEVSGKTTNLVMELSGSGEIETSKLATENATVDLTGSGNIEINCDKNLKARLTGSGNIYYSGNPETTDKKISGSGTIKKN